MYSINRNPMSNNTQFLNPLKKFLKILTLYPIGVRYPIFFLIVSAIIAFYLQAQLAGWTVIFFRIFYIPKISPIIMLVLTLFIIIRVKFILFHFKGIKKISIKLTSLIWLYSWIQFFAIILSVGGDDVNFYPALYWIPIVKKWWLSTSSTFRNKYYLISLLLLIILIILYTKIVKQMNKEKNIENKR